MGRQGWPAFKEEEATRSDEMTESWGVALIYVRRSMVRYDEDRVSAQRRRGRATSAIISTSARPRVLATMGVRWRSMTALSPAPPLEGRKKKLGPSYPTGGSQPLGG